MPPCLQNGKALYRCSSFFQQPSICPICEHTLLSRPTRLARSYPSTRRRSQATWAQAVSVAQNILSNGASKAQGPLAGMSLDPLRTVGKELQFLNRNLRQLLGSGHPILDTVARYYTQSEGKHIRPLLVLLMSQATALTPKVHRDTPLPNLESIDNSISPLSILSDTNPSKKQHSAPPFLATGIPDHATSIILPSQRRLAEITELIHTASLLHDDVIDISTTRRSAPSANIAFGNKMAVLAGDFLLGRASVALARLRDSEVIELLATVIANLVEGEFMQLKNTALDESNPTWTEDTLSYYLQKTYLKSASLISKSCRAAALLGQSSPKVVEASYQYGRSLGLAFQLVDDMLDYMERGEDLGKPAGADLELGLATAPLLFAWKERPELGALVGRKFKADGDVQMVGLLASTFHLRIGKNAKRCSDADFMRQARDLVSRSSGIQQTGALAQDYADRAIQAIVEFPESEAKQGLVEMCEKTMKRRK